MNRRVPAVSTTPRGPSTANSLLLPAMRGVVYTVVELWARK